MVLPKTGAVLFYRYSITRNLRASILAQKDVVGDVIWMMRGEKGRVSGNDIIKSDLSAAKRLSELKPGDWVPTKSQPVPTLKPTEVAEDQIDHSEGKKGEIISRDEKKDMDMTQENAQIAAAAKKNTLAKMEEKHE